MTKITESDIELYAIEELEKQGYVFIHGPDIAPDGKKPERKEFSNVILTNRLNNFLLKLNPHITQSALDQALQEVKRIFSPELIVNNQAFHKYLTEGVRVSYLKDGVEKNETAWLVDFTNPENNENKRPDIVLFINGLPLVVIELKNAIDEKATVRKAYDQLQTYKSLIPSLFTYNSILIASV